MMLSHTSGKTNYNLYKQDNSVDLNHEVVVRYAMISWDGLMKSAIQNELSSMFHGNSRSYFCFATCGPVNKLKWKEIASNSESDWVDWDWFKIVEVGESFFGFDKCFPKDSCRMVFCTANPPPKPKSKETWPQNPITTIVWIPPDAALAEKEFYEALESQVLSLFERGVTGDTRKESEFEKAIQIPTELAPIQAQQREVEIKEDQEMKKKEWEEYLAKAKQEKEKKGEAKKQEKSAAQIEQPKPSNNECNLL